MSLNTSPSTSISTSYRRQQRYLPGVERRPRILKCALLTSLIFVLGFCGVILLLRYFAKDTSQKTCQECVDNKKPESGFLGSVRCHEVCTAEDCVKTAADMMSRMDTRNDPCDDFHSFACGKYNKISMGKTKREQFMFDAAESVIHVLAGIIENIPKQLPENKPGYTASKARNLYDSCVSFHSTEEMAIPTMMKYLEYFGIKNWPYLNSDYQFVNPDLNEAITRLSFYEANIIFSFEIPENSKTMSKANVTESSRSDAAMNISIKVQASRRSLFRSSISEDNTLNRMRDILSDFGLSDAIINATIGEVLAFDEALNKIQRKSHRRISDCIFNASVSCSDFYFDCSEERSRKMESWCKIAENVMNATGIREKYPYFNIVLEDKYYFEDATALINKTGDRAIAHGLALYIFTRNLIMMNYRFRRMSGVTGLLKELLEKFQEERSFLCASWVIGHLPGILAGAFYSSQYSGDLQKEGEEIYEDIQRHLISHTRNMTWMDKGAQESLEELLWGVKMSLNIYLPYISDASELDEFYKRLQITDESFLANMMELRRFRYSSQILYHDNTTLVSYRERPKFQFNPSFQQDVIVMDFSSFIYPLISKARPRYSNLGFFGSFLAHEFSHAVEVFLRDRENMSYSFEQALLNKKKCLIDQYSEYEIDLINKKINGSYTLHENMADFFSIRPAYQALKSYQEKHGAQRTLPGLHFNVEQLFFISYAQWWCESNTPETMKLYLDDPHSPGKYRVLGIMKNFEPFSSAFNCPLGSPMNPVQKCDF